jgi:hypothetical protein
MQHKKHIKSFIQIDFSEQFLLNNLSNYEDNNLILREWRVYK